MNFSPQIGLSEIIVLILLLIIFTKPKDLPKILRLVGGFVMKIRLLSFQINQQLQALIHMADLDDEEDLLTKRTKTKKISNKQSKQNKEEDSQTK